MVRINLYHLLQDKDWTQRQLSIKTDVRENTISDMCNNTSKMVSIKNLDRICKALNCEIKNVLEYIPD